MTTNSEGALTPSLRLQPVDAVEILILMDNALDVLAADTPVARRVRLDRDAFSRPALRAEHGLSFMVTMIDGERRDTMLFDTGISRDGVAHNLDVLGLDLSTVRTVVLSHGHPDHSRGLEGLAGRLGRRLPILFHPDALLLRRLAFPDGRELALRPPRLSDLGQEGFQLVDERGPTFMFEERALLSGQVARTTEFEQGFPIHQAERDGAWQPDPWIYDDQALAVHVRDKGLVVVTGCGHAGAINILRDAQAKTGVGQIYAVVGGLHLTGAIFEPIIARTVDALSEMAPRVVVPTHCSGWRATHQIARALPDAYVFPSVGTTVCL
jgi:7,8-dihydropterin-6-yl-methyl-4-(beta-D-ribofuranosyl)aminobenzene 5'-phosphate synthase